MSNYPFVVLFSLLVSANFRTLTAVCITNGGEKPGLPCVFPFKYGGVTYNACTARSSDYGLWCSTAVDAEGEHIVNNWGYCSPECFRPCNTIEGIPCIFPFIYHAVAYHGCTDKNSVDGSYWCSTAVDLDGITIPDHWGTCDNFCFL